MNLSPIPHPSSFAALIVALSVTIAIPSDAQTRPILAGSVLSSGFGMGVASSTGHTNWLTREAQDMKMAYPKDATWGAVFITVGEPKDAPHPSEDFSAFDTLSVEMKGDAGGENLDISLKSDEQPDDGSESRQTLKLTPQWHTYTFPLKKFIGANLRRVYVAAEFVFSGSNPETVYLRNVQYANGAAIVSSPFPSRRQESSRAEEPQLSISYPANHSVVVSPSGKRPSILVRGIDKAIPPGSKVYLILHPMQSDDVWASEVSLNGDQWIGQAYIGETAALPNNGEAYEVFAAVAEHTLPPTFAVQSQPLSYTSDIILITVQTVSWWDKVFEYGKEWQISVPLSAFFTAIGGLVGIVLKSKLDERYPK